MAGARTGEDCGEEVITDIIFEPEEGVRYTGYLVDRLIGGVAHLGAYLHGEEKSLQLFDTRDYADLTPGESPMCSDVVRDKIEPITRFIKYSDGDFVFPIRSTD